MNSSNNTMSLYISGILKLLLFKMLDLSILIPLKIRYFIMDIASFTFFSVNRLKRNAVKKNLQLIFGYSPSFLEILKVFIEYGRYWAELPDINGLWEKNRFLYCGTDFPPKEKDFLGVTFHIGNFELFGNVLYASTNSDFTVIAERLHPNFITDYFKSRRLKHHIKTVLHDDLRQILNVLKNGGGLGLLCDRMVGGRGIETRLFGKRVMMPLNIVEYAVTHSIPIYISYIVKDFCVYKIFSRRVDPTNNSFENVIAEIIKELEAAIKKYPYQWHVLTTI